MTTLVITIGAKSRHLVRQELSDGGNEKTDKRFQLRPSCGKRKKPLRPDKNMLKRL